MKAGVIIDFLFNLPKSIMSPLVWDLRYRQFIHNPGPASAARQTGKAVTVLETWRGLPFSPWMVVISRSYRNSTLKSARLGRFRQSSDLKILLCFIKHLDKHKVIDFDTLVSRLQDWKNLNLIRNIRRCVLSKYDKSRSKLSPLHVLQEAKAVNYSIKYHQG